MNTTTQKNIALALCLSSMIIAAPQAEAAINVVDDKRTVTTDLSITDVGNVGAGRSEEAAVSSVERYNGFDVGANTVSLQGNTYINVGTDKYALYAASVFASGATATIDVNPNSDKTVQIIGNVKTYVVKQDATKALIKLNLSNANSYLVGDIVAESENVNLAYASRMVVEFTLKNGATWYPTKDTYSLGTVDAYDQKIGINIDASSGGVIDIYHSAPGTVRSTGGSRTFTLSNISEKNGGANGATFRIGSDIANNTEDKIILNGDTTGTAMPTSSNYYIQVVGDASITTTENITYDLASQQIVVAQIDGSKLTNTNTTIAAGGIYRNAAINGGLSLADITTAIDAKPGSNNEWILNSLEISNIRTGGGPAMGMAQLGAAGAQTAAAAWRADNNDLMRRMGDLRSGDGESGAWGKIYGGQIEARQGVGSKLDYRAVQVGFDRAHTLGDGRLFTGVTLSHLRGDMSSVAGNGDLNSTMFGIYGSYVGKRGHFADLIIKYGRMNNKINSYDATNSYGGEFGSNGINISAEYGYRHNFNNNVYIEPQVELTYSNLGGSDYTMRLNGGQGASVHSDAYKSLIGRIGFTLGKQYKQNNVYLKLGLAHEFQGDVGLLAMYNGVSAPYKVSGKSTWMEYGIGFNVAAGKNTNFYGEVEKTTGTVIRTNWRAHLGMRYSF